jgi:hypothetical protein
MESSKFQIFTEKAKFIVELVKLFAEMHWLKIVVITASIIALYLTGVI